MLEKRDPVNYTCKLFVTKTAIFVYKYFIYIHTCSDRILYPNIVTDNFMWNHDEKKTVSHLIHYVVHTKNLLLGSQLLYQVSVPLPC